MGTRRAESILARPRRISGEAKRSRFVIPKLHDVGGGILERDELATTGKRNRIVEGAFPVRLWLDGQRRIPSVACAA
jgi:hypothetical protein